MTPYDYAVLVFYFVYMLVISWVFRRFVSNISDYFRGGGKAVWWMVGGSAFMAAFSAWTFTGAASKAYSDGWPITVIFVANAVGFVLNATYFAPRFRQLRVITSVEAIRLRFGRTSEQVFTWVQIPLTTLQAAIWLNALGVFFAAAFGLELNSTIIVTGVVVLLMALVGGSWAVLAGDFIQVLILMPVCLAVTVLALARVAGWDGFIQQLPRGHASFDQIFSKEFLGLWCLAMLLKQISSTNNLFEASRYLAVKDSRHARWAGYLGAILFVIGIAIWFIPPMVARIVVPDLHAVFPGLRNPEEASFIAIAREVMPIGMMGLLVSGIFAATMSGMDSGLNKNAGIFIKNFYQPFLRKAAPDRHYLNVGKVVTVILGVVVILASVYLSRLNGLNLFLQMQRVSILIAVPIAVPLLLGILIKRTPPWSAWSTVLVGFLCSLFIGDYLTANWAAAQFGVTLDATSKEYWTQSIQFFGNVIIATLWFLGTMFFWERTSAAHKAEIEDFFQRLNTPVDFNKEEGAHNANDDQQQTAVGWLSVAYGVFVMLLALIPQATAAGRLAFVGCGVLVLMIGIGLVLAGRRKPALA